MNKTRKDHLVSLSLYCFEDHIIPYTFNCLLSSLLLTCHKKKAFHTSKTCRPLLQYLILILRDCKGLDKPYFHTKWTLSKLHKWRYCKLLYWIEKSDWILHPAPHQPPTTHAPMHHTHEPTHAQPTLPIRPRPNLTPPKWKALGLHYTAPISKNELICS